MEAKLKEYRALRRRRELIESAKDKLEQSKKKFVEFITPNFLKEMDKHKDEELLLMEDEDTTPIDLPPTQQRHLEEPVDVASETSEVESLEPEKQESWRYFSIKWSFYTLTWLALYIFFLKLQFGAVFFVLSFLIGIYLNTRTRPRKKGEVSAYSVFNENCVSIDGTLKAEQFEREIMFGAGGMRI